MGCFNSKLVYKGYVCTGYDRHPHPKLSNFVLVKKGSKIPETNVLNVSKFIKTKCTVVKFLVDGKIYNMPVLNIDA